MARLQAGGSVALVTDAGTPGVSDPGFHLVRLAREAGIPVVPIPGPSAVVAALSASGVPGDRFVFEGFLPARPGRRLARLRALQGLGRPVVLYESPHRLAATLEAVEAVFGAVEVVVARELTKQFEEFRRGTPAELRAAFPPAGVRGEVTVIVNPGRPGRRAGRRGRRLIYWGDHLSDEHRERAAEPRADSPRPDHRRLRFRRRGGHPGRPEDVQRLPGLRRLRPHRHHRPELDRASRGS